MIRLGFLALAEAGDGDYSEAAFQTLGGIEQISGFKNSSRKLQNRH